jgi:hypothetical protein
MSWIKQELVYLWGTFHASETIIWARFNMVLGAAITAAQATDLSPIFSNPKYLAFWMIFSNFMTEMGRRRNAEYDDRGNMK